MADHRDRLRSGRDIRLSTATMRALNPRRPPTIFPRFLVSFALLLFVAHLGEPRSVHENRGPSAGRSVIADEEVNAGPVPVGSQRGSIASHDPRVQGSSPGDNRVRGNDLAGDDKVVSEEITTSDEKVSAVGGRRQGVDDPGTGESSEVPKQEDEDSSVVKKRRRNDVALAGKSDVKTEDEAIRRFDVRIDAEKGETEKSGEIRDEVHDSLRKSGKLAKDEEDGPRPEEGREVRSFAESQGKSKRKSSTVYLSAEEKKISDGEQQSIVEGQIKKWISIRDGALDAQKDSSDPKRVAGVDEVAITHEEIRDGDSDRDLGDRSADTIVKKWIEQATELQELIRDKAYLSSLKDQEVLPDVPKFTENQLLETLERVVQSTKPEPLNGPNRLTDNSSLSNVQQQILRYTEQLLSAQERHTFENRVSECIEELGFANCARIFAWPVIAYNLPKSIVESLSPGSQNLNLLPKQKSGRAQNLQQLRLLTPDTVIYNILQDALLSYPSDETFISYIDPNNDTLKKLLTSDQLAILQMAEKFLPEALRREYSDKMFSCVRRFEYLSCVKYFAWPLVKQYFPGLPSFPDYQSWYPIIDLSPHYPIFPFPGSLEDIGELPEVVDADGTRTRKPKPELVIFQVLQNTLKEQQTRVSTSQSFLDQSSDTHVALIPEDQLLTINMAEQLIPISYRPEFVQKTVRCMKEYNYLSCFKYSAWPTVRRFIPTLPDISSILPDFQTQGISEIGAYVPQISTYPDLRLYLPVNEAPIRGATTAQSYVTLKNPENLLKTSDELEIKILDILLKTRKSLEKEKETFMLAGNAVTFTKRQIDILQLAECLIPSSARSAFISEILAYLQKNNNFIDAARYVMWPTVSKYVSSLPEFPTLDILKERIDAQEGTRTKEIIPGETVQERVAPDSDKIYSQNKESRNRVPDTPVISVSGTRFVPIFTEHPESVILNILRSVQLQSFKTTPTTPAPAIKNQQFLDYLTEQQVNIISIVDSLLPESSRPEFANKMIDCLRVSNFLICTRDVVWPVLIGYFPWLPNFPNFGIVASSPPNASIPINQNITEHSASLDTPPLSETDVKTGQHGDTTVTITDTRFFPIYNELPETIILNILKAVQLSIPNLPGATAPLRPQDYSGYLTEQQISILQIAENLLPTTVRSEFIDRISSCTKERNFLECTRDITWPIMAQFYPWLPSFPNFGTLQNLPQASSSNSIRFQVFLSEKPTPNLETQKILIREAEEKIENALLNLLKQTPDLNRSYLNATDSISSILTPKQINIIRLVERALPENARLPYVTRMIDCALRYSFLACTNSISWPFLKQFSFLPDLSSITNWLPDLGSSLPDLGSITGGLPDLGSITGGLPDLGSVLPSIPLPQLTLGFQPLAIQKPQSLPPLGNQEIKITGNAPSISISQLPSTSQQPIGQQLGGNSQNPPLQGSLGNRFAETAGSIGTSPANSQGPIGLQQLPQQSGGLLNPQQPQNLQGTQGNGLTGNAPSIGTSQLPAISQPSIGLQQLPQLSGGLGNSKIPLPGTEGNKIIENASSIGTSQLPVTSQSSIGLQQLPQLPGGLGNSQIPQNLPGTQGNKIIEFPIGTAPLLASSQPQIGLQQLPQHPGGLGNPQIPQNLPLPGTQGNKIIEFPIGIAPLLASSQPQIGLQQLPQPSGGLGNPQIPQNLSLPGTQGNKIIENASSIGTSQLPTTSQPPLGLQKLPQLSSGLGNSQIPQNLPLPGAQGNKIIENASSTGTSQLPGTSQSSIGLQQLPQLPGGLGNSKNPPNLQGNKISGNTQSTQLPATSQRPAGLQQTPQKSGGLATHNSLNAQRQENKISGSTPITPSVGNEGVPGYAGQPPGIPLDISGERIDLSGKRQTETKDSVAKSRQRRSATDVPGSYYDTEDKFESVDKFPNVTESEYLRLLIEIREKRRSSGAGFPKPKRYVVDTLNSTIRNNLTADQYEILRAVDDLDDQPSGKGIASQVIQCITGLSFIRCVGIFVWPLIVNNLPLPSFPSFGLFGRSLETENGVQDFFGMSADNFEKELLERKESIEGLLLDWYRKLVEDKFQMDVGLFKIKGYGNGELGVSVSGFREGRGAKIKDNKNLPSILTIISDIMEEVLDQRPEGEKQKKDKEKKERSIDDSRESDYQFLKDSEEYVDIKRSMNDQEIITMFLDRIRANDSDYGDDSLKYFTADDAYNAFEVLFGTKLHDKLDPPKDVDIVSLDSEKDSADLKVLPLNSQVTYDLEKESARDQEQRQREKRAKNFFKSFLEKRPDKYFKDFHAENFEDNKVDEEYPREDKRSSLIVKLPSLHDEILSRKVTDSVGHFGRGLKSKMMQMMPGFGLIFTFLVQTALAHARTAASVAGMLSNIALGSAMFGMVRDSLMGSNDQPKIKYVYDNDKMGPGITWPSYHDPHYYG